MDPKEYVKTIVYNGHMVNIGLDDAGQQFILEYVNDEGNLTEFCCGAYTSFEYGLDHLFGPVKIIGLTYKGFTTRIQWSEPDKCYHGKIENIFDLVLFDGETIEECEKDFYDAVDRYLEMKRSFHSGRVATNTGIDK